MIEELSDLLSVSTDSIYRRVRGETAITLEEMVLISNHFQLSLDAILSNSALQDSSVSFRFQNFGKSVQDYLEFMLKELQFANADKSSIILTAKDLPSFYFFMFPELLIFKSYFYARVLWEADVLEAHPFDIEKSSRLLNTIFSGIHDFAPKIVLAYQHLNSLEVWNDNTLDGHLNHILYSWQSGFFADKKNAIQILNKTHDLLSHIKKQAVTGSKFYNKEDQTFGNFELYYSEGLQLENTILVDSATSKKTYLIYNTGDYLLTSNASFFERTQKYMENMKMKSSLISKVGEKERNRLFMKISEKIERTKQRIELS